jgi:predicted  nucleic acid-binding Zn-ribbon protein
MSKAEPLYRLQLLDIDLDKARKQLRDVEGALSSNPAVLHAQAEFNAAQQTHHKLSSDLRSMELEARVMDDKLKADEDRLYTGNIRTPKELIDLQHEVEILKRHRGEMDDKLLTAMMGVEEAGQVVQRCQAAVDEATRHWQEDSVGLHEERKQLLDRISANEERREAICIAIPRADLNTYTVLRTKKPNGVAVVLVKDGACGQCGESASSVLLQQTRTGSSLTTCTTCGRILYIG